MTGCGWEDAPYWPSPLRCTGVCGARIDKLVGKALGRWPPSALSQRNRRLSGECRIKRHPELDSSDTQNWTPDYAIRPRIGPGGDADPWRLSARRPGR